MSFENGPVHQSKTQFTPQPIPPIRKQLQASYPPSSEGSQKTNQTDHMDHTLVYLSETMSQAM